MLDGRVLGASGGIESIWKTPSKEREAPVRAAPILTALSELRDGRHFLRCLEGSSTVS